MNNFCEYFLNQIETFGPTPAFVVSDQEGLTFNGFTELVNSFTCQLQNIGVCETHKVCLIAPNSEYYLALFLSVVGLNGTVIPLNPDYKPMELSDYLGRIQPTWILTTPKFGDRFDGHNLIVYDKSDLKVFHNHNETRHALSKAAVVFLSSGTTGNPKLVMIDQMALISQMENVYKMKLDPSLPKLNSGDVCLSVLPYFHAGGLITALIMLQQGICIVRFDKFNRDRFVQSISLHNVSILTVIPIIVHVMLQYPTACFKSVRTLFVGGDSISLQVLHQINSTLASANVVQLYGSTEAGVLLFMRPLRPDFPLDSIGCPLPGVEARISERGELLVRSNMMTSGIEVDDDGFICTGDLAEKVGDAYFIRGRTKFVFKVKGYQVSPYELEHAIKAKFPALAEIVVYYKNRGINALYQLKHDTTMTSEEIRQFVADNFVKYKHIDGMIEQTDDFKRTVSGKIERGHYSQ